MSRDVPSLVLRIARRTAPVSTGAGAEAFNAGLASAPLFAGFLLHVLDAARRERVEALHFLTREGEFFADLYALLARDDDPARGPAPPARLLEVSRAATFPASLGEPSIDEMMRLWRGFDRQSMAAWAGSLGVDPALAAGWSARHRIGFEEPIAKPWTDSRVLALLGDPECRETVSTLAATRRGLLLGYLKAQGVDRATAALVDIGWRGTIQDNLALVLPGTRFTGHYLGLQRFLNPQPPNVVKEAYGPDLNVSTRDADLFGDLPLIETLCRSRHGGVIGHERDADGRVMARRAADEADDPLLVEIIDRYQAGVRHAVSVWAAEGRARRVPVDTLRDIAMAAWRRLDVDTPPVLARARAGLRHDERFGLGRFDVTRPPRRSPWRRLIRSR